MLKTRTEKMIDQLTFLSLFATPVISLVAAYFSFQVIRTVSQYLSIN